MSYKERFLPYRKIYILAHRPARAHDWMIAHGFLVPGVWRDERVEVLCIREQIATLQKGDDVAFKFLDRWREGHTPLFLEEFFFFLET